MGCGTGEVFFPAAAHGQGDGWVSEIWLVRDLTAGGLVLAAPGRLLAFEAGRADGSGTFGLVGGGEGVHFGEDLGGFVFEGVALAVVVVFGEFAGAEFEVKVAEVVVDDVFALAEVVEAGFFADGGEGGAALGPEDEGAEGDEEEGAGEDDAEIHERGFPSGMTTSEARGGGGAS